MRYFAIHTLRQERNTQIVKDVRFMQALYYHNRADYAILAFIRELRERYGPLDPNVNEDYRNWLIEQGKISPDKSKQNIED